MKDLNTNIIEAYKSTIMNPGNDLKDTFESKLKTEIGITILNGANPFDLSESLTESIHTIFDSLQRLYGKEIQSLVKKFYKIKQKSDQNKLNEAGEKLNKKFDEIIDNHETNISDITNGDRIHEVGTILANMVRSSKLTTVEAKRQYQEATAVLQQLLEGKEKNLSEPENEVVVDAKNKILENAKHLAAIFNEEENNQGGDFIKEVRNQKGIFDSKDLTKLNPENAANQTNPFKISDKGRITRIELVNIIKNTYDKLKESNNFQEEFIKSLKDQSIIKTKEEDKFKAIFNAYNMLSDVKIPKLANNSVEIINEKINEYSQDYKLELGVKDSHHLSQIVQEEYDIVKNDLINNQQRFCNNLSIMLGLESKEFKGLFKSLSSDKHEIKDILLPHEIKDLSEKLNVPITKGKLTEVQL